MPSHHINKITLSTFNRVLSRYASAVPAKLQDLDASRYDTIPTSVANLRSDKSLSKDEVEKLVEWKLKHGTFRPKLLALVQSNSANVVHDATKEAFEVLPDATSALKVLVALKGIGPATASLLLSVAAPATVPFFSDELFRWCMWDESGSPGGWQRKIKYNAKEYEMMLGQVDALVKRLGVRALDAEQVAWALGKERMDIDAEHDEFVDDAVKGEESASEEAVEVTKPQVQAGTKRKASETKPQAEGIRKSARTKK